MQNPKYDSTLSENYDRLFIEKKIQAKKSPVMTGLS
jgi:hypothetical protein